MPFVLIWKTKQQYRKYSVFISFYYQVIFKGKKNPCFYCVSNKLSTGQVLNLKAVKEKAWAPCGFFPTLQNLIGSSELMFQERSWAWVTAYFLCLKISIHCWTQCPVPLFCFIFAEIYASFPDWTSSSMWDLFQLALFLVKVKKTHIATMLNKVIFVLSLWWSDVVKHCGETQHSTSLFNMKFILRLSLLFLPVLELATWLISQKLGGRPDKPASCNSHTLFWSLPCRLMSSTFDLKVLL